MPAPTVLVSKTIYKDPTSMTNYTVKVNFSGSIVFGITANAEATSPTWNTVPIQNGVAVSGTFLQAGSCIRYRAIGNVGDHMYSGLTITYS